MKDQTIVSCVSIIGLIALEGIAILTKTDGAYFMPIVAVVGGLAGYQASQHLESIKRANSCS